MSVIDLFGNPSNADTGARSDLDWYETPSWMTRALIHHHPILRGSRVLECASGNDAITVVLREEAGCTVFTNDINTAHPSQTHFDATTDAYWRQAPPVEWVVSNFPFDVAFEILTRAYRHACLGVAVLLRKTFLEPTVERGPWLAQYPPACTIALPRHKFRPDTDHSDSVSCDWMIWHKGAPSSAYVFDVLAKTRRRA